MTVVLDDGTELGRKGKLLFSDISVDPTSGQVTLRAQIANPDQALLPGQYVRVRLAQAELPSGILVPQQAVTRGGPNGDTLMVIGADNKPTPRTVKIASQNGSNWVVTGWPEGRRAGDGRRLPEAADAAAGHAGAAGRLDAADRPAAPAAAGAPQPAERGRPGRRRRPAVATRRRPVRRPPAPPPARATPASKARIEQDSQWHVFSLTAPFSPG